MIHSGCAQVRQQIERLDEAGMEASRLSALLREKGQLEAQVATRLAEQERVTAHLQAAVASAQETLAMCGQHPFPSHVRATPIPPKPQ